MKVATNEKTCENELISRNIPIIIKKQISPPNQKIKDTIFSLLLLNA